VNEVLLSLIFIIIQRETFYSFPYFSDAENKGLVKLEVMVLGSSRVETVFSDFEICGWVIR
jgi:hypothetical protein